MSTRSSFVQELLRVEVENKTLTLSTTRCYSRCPQQTTSTLFVSHRRGRHAEPVGTRYSWPATLIAATRACNAAARWAGPRRRHSMPTLPLSVDQASPGRDTANCPRRPRPRQRRPERQRERDEAGARGRGGRGEREPRRSSGDNLEAAAKVNKGRRRETETGLTGNDDHRYRTEIGRRQCRQSALTCRIMSSRPLADFIASFQRGLMAELGVETIRGQML